MRTWKCDTHCGSAGIDERSRTASGGFTAVRTAACTRCDADGATVSAGCTGNDAGQPAGQPRAGAAPHR